MRYSIFRNILYLGSEIKTSGKESGGGVLTSVISEAEYSSYGKEAATKTRYRDIEAVGNRGTGRNHY